MSVFNESYPHVMWNNSAPVCSSSDIPHYSSVFPAKLQNLAVNGSNYTQTLLTQRSAKECRSIFGRPFVSDYSFVFLSVHPNPENSSYLDPCRSNLKIQVNSRDALDPAEDGCVPDPYKWICDGEYEHAGATCDKVCDINNITNATYHAWTPFDNHTVESCWTPPADDSCTLEINWHFLIIVVVFTLIKSALLFAAISALHDAPILTIGDAVSSFLNDPDPTTQQVPFLQKADIKLYPWCWSTSPRFWTRRKLRRIRAANSKRLGFFMVMCVRRAICPNPYCRADIISSRYAAVLGLVAFGLTQGVTNTKSSTSLASIMGLGFGAVDSRTLITDWGIPKAGMGSLWLNALVANFAQPVLSSCYFFYNSLLTNLLLANEWDQYADAAPGKGLRVSSHPRGMQRSTHFLQLPFRFAIPLLIASAVLHWLASQSIFAVSVELDKGGSVATCGFSPPAMVALVAWTVVMLVFPALYGARRFKNGMPVVGSCSAAISAACHHHRPRWSGDGEGRKGIELLPVQWGVVEADDNYFYCGFSNEETALPDCSMDFACWARKVKEVLDDQGLLPYITDSPHNDFRTWKIFRGVRRLYAHWDTNFNASFPTLLPEGSLDYLDAFARQVIFFHISSYTAEDLSASWFTASELWESLHFKFGKDASARESYTFWHWFLFERKKRREVESLR